MTLIYSDNDIGGLEVMDRAGNWGRPLRAATAPSRSISAIFNDALDCNDRWQSTLHRVVNSRRRRLLAQPKRLSLGMFFIPNYDAEIAPLPGGEAPRYAPITVADYRTERFARTAGADAD